MPQFFPSRAELLSPGQAALEPLHTSIASQTLVAARQMVPAGRTPSAGHVADIPVQNSATSQAPATARQSAVEGLRLQLVVDRAGLHSWHEALGLVAPTG